MAVHNDHIPNYSIATYPRSLLALSLILALLLFKPAPMYILDEVDAALDLSHAQHCSKQSGVIVLF